jgi:3-methylfumaryl-CoA hydratase
MSATDTQLAAELAATDWTAWVGRTDRRSMTASSQWVGLLEASLDRPLPAQGSALEPLRHWLWLFAPPAWPTATLGEDGHGPRGPLVPTWPLPRRMWAGSSIQWLAPMPLDAPLEVRSTIESINIKTGRSGTLGFVSLRNRWYSGDVCGIDELQTAVYREAAGASASAPAAATAPSPVPAPPAGDWEARFKPSAPLLFRYSAVSFNTHRIHYDHPYTTGIEGYPGLVVHGPLLGTLMFDTWRHAHPGKTPRQFVFRNQQPAFVDNDVSCGGVEIGPGKSRVWVRHADGSEHVAGEVSYE